MCEHKEKCNWKIRDQCVLFSHHLTLTHSEITVLCGGFPLGATKRLHRYFPMTASLKAEGRLCWLEHGWGAHSSSELLLYIGHVLSLLHLTL